MIMEELNFQKLGLFEYFHIEHSFYIYILLLNSRGISCEEEVASEQNPEKFLINMIGSKTFLEQANILKTSWITTPFDEIITNSIKKFIFLLLA